MGHDVEGDEHGVKCLHGGEWIDLAGEHGRCGTVLRNDRVKQMREKH